MLFLSGGKLQKTFSFGFFGFSPKRSYAFVRSFLIILLHFAKWRKKPSILPALTIHRLSLHFSRLADMGEGPIAECIGGFTAIGVPSLCGLPWILGDVFRGCYHIVYNYGNLRAGFADGE
ncbi:hypothetical protein VNO77_04487 [Canavalia gladiata]|uniref:Uncharacterized protein n=1 Tax=Canavalia gladiata TaxID=3824 RepID=A0AAN9R7T2_CANGL